MKKSQNKKVQAPGKQISPSLAETRRLVAIIEKSQVPFGESAPTFNRIRGQVEAGKELSTEDYEHLLGLVKKAKDWNRDVESSAETSPEETLAG